MTEVAIIENPQLALKQFICEYAMEFHNVPRGKASAVAVLIDHMFDSTIRPAERIKAASDLIKYTETPARSTEIVAPKTGPDVAVFVIGVVGIDGRPLIQAEDGVYEPIEPTQ